MPSNYGSQGKSLKHIGEAHRRYTRMINFREDWRGYLWQGRFHSFVMDESYLPAAVRHIELNPVRARLVTDPIAYPWSSARAHIEKRDDVPVRVSPLLELIADYEPVRECPFSSTLCHAQKIILGISTIYLR